MDNLVTEIVNRARINKSTFTFKQVCKRAGLGVNYLSSLASERQSPRLDNLRRLTKAMDELEAEAKEVAEQNTEASKVEVCDIINAID